MVKQLVIAGTHSGVGKTTLVVGLIGALRRRGLVVQPFKVGPDYIDPTHHTRAAGRPCANLDTWMVPADRVKTLFRHMARGADVALIEGVMGLYDGQGYDAETGSTAEVAKLLGAPVVLVMDASRMARSAGALALGYRDFDRDVPLAGFVVNCVGSEGHAAGVAAAITRATGLPVLGRVPREDRLRVPERHLGLVPTAEPGDWQALAGAAAEVVERCLDVERLLALAGEVDSTSAAVPAPARSARGPRPVIAVARDEAFHFTYEGNLELIIAAGAEIAFFSPLHDTGLPAGTAGLIVSGGFPEVYAAGLAANAAMHEAIRAAHARDVPIYAECGGLMYLSEAIVDFEGCCHPMVGLLPGHTTMSRRLTLGYRTAQAANPSWLFERGEMVRGHEFHYSAWEGRPAHLPAAYRLLPPGGTTEPQPEGACAGNLWASYVHLHFWAKPELAGRFVAACRRHVPRLVTEEA